MRFSISIPDPASLRAGKAGYRQIKAGARLHRVHPGRYSPAQFNNTDKEDARFSPIRDSSGRIIPTIYAAQSFECAACEIILRCPDVPAIDPGTGTAPLQIVFPADFRDFAHSTLEVASDLNLVDVTIAGQRKIGIDRNVLLAGPRSTYPATRAWAEAIHAQCPAAHGIYYTSVQFGPEFAIVLFADRMPPGALRPQASRDIAEPACHDEIRILASGLSIDYQDI